MRDILNAYNPKISFAYFMLIVILSMIFINPFILVMGFTGAIAYTLLVEGKSIIRRLVLYIPLFILIATLNPLFSTHGNTVLFTYLGGRRFTYEALINGICVASFCITVFLWFGRYSKVIQKDKLMYIFGKIFPAISMVLITGLRFIPDLVSKTKKVEAGRYGIGKHKNDSRIREGMQTVLVMTTWALENAGTTSDSMRGRGYGLGKRTCFSDYRMRGKDICLLIIMVITTSAIVVCSIGNEISCSFYPSFYTPEVNLRVAIVYLAYLILYFTPFILNLREEIRWNNTR